MTQEYQEENYTLAEHLDELRKRIIYIIIGSILATMGTYMYSEQIIEYLTMDIHQLSYLKPMEAFIVRIKASLLAGFILIIPYNFFHFWKFIGAGLTKAEKKHIYLYIPFSVISFLIGGSFAFKLVIPLAVEFFMSFQSDILTPMISVTSYFSLIVSLIFAFGILFQLPIVILFLTKIGLVTPKLLREKRKHVIVVIFIIAALLTPPDVITQTMLAIPILLLYELSILLSYSCVKKT